MQRTTSFAATACQSASNETLRRGRSKFPATEPETATLVLPRHPELPQPKPVHDLGSAGRSRRAEWAALRRATGIRYGEQLT